MGSHLMHLVIANEVLAHLTDVDRTAFLLGNLAPDATTSKQNTHYYAGRHEDMTRRLDLNQYWMDSVDENQSFRLGYYCHLVADEIWLQGFYKSWLKQVITKDPEKQAMYYADFDAYNARLAQRLGVFDFTSVKNHATNELRELVVKVERDAKATEEGTYTMFLPHQLDGYVETCILRCRQMVQQKSEVTT